MKDCGQEQKCQAFPRGKLLWDWDRVLKMNRRPVEALFAGLTARFYKPMWMPSMEIGAVESQEKGMILRPEPGDVKSQHVRFERLPR